MEGEREGGGKKLDKASYLHCVLHCARASSCLLKAGICAAGFYCFFFFFFFTSCCCRKRLRENQILFTSHLACACAIARYVPSTVYSSGDAQIWKHLPRLRVFVAAGAGKTHSVQAVRRVLSHLYSKQDASLPTKPKPGSVWTDSYTQTRRNKK